MNLKSIFLLTLLSFAINSFSQESKTTKVYELRVYYCNEGKLETLLTRFRNHTTKLFEKHGMTNVGYWLPINNEENKLVYILSYPSVEARDKSWKDFMEDPEWKSVMELSEVKGKIIKNIESTMLSETDFSQSNFSNATNRIFELRTYEATKNNLGILLARFRNHTCALFEKHGMTNLAYFTPISGEEKLIYLLAHESATKAVESFDAFRQDTYWKVIKEASETLAKGSVTISVKSEYLTPTDFSMWK